MSLETCCCNARCSCSGFSSSTLGTASSFPEGYGPPNAVAGVVYLLVIIGLIGGSYALLMNRYRKVGMG